VVFDDLENINQRYDINYYTLSKYNPLLRLQQHHNTHRYMIRKYRTHYMSKVWNTCPLFTIRKYRTHNMSKFGSLVLDSPYHLTMERKRATNHTSIHENNFNLLLFFNHGKSFCIYELKHPSEKDNKPADTSTEKTVTSMFLFFINKYKLIAGYLKSPHPFGQKVDIIQAVHYGIATEHMGFNDKKNTSAKKYIKISCEIRAW
jgi:hypothetical protein